MSAPTTWRMRDATADNWISTVFACVQLQLVELQLRIGAGVSGGAAGGVAFNLPQAPPFRNELWAVSKLDPSASKNTHIFLLGHLK